MERVYNKLVRDRIPEIIIANDETPVTRILDDADYKKSLEEKLYEEYEEVLSSEGTERCEELADMIEVIRALAQMENKTLEEIIGIADEKREKSGGFEEKIFLEKVLSEKEE